MTVDLVDLANLSSEVEKPVAGHINLNFLVLVFLMRSLMCFKGIAF